jgi:hypothetical protein
VIQDIREKGTTDNCSTRTGEGFQQESAQAYEQTNMKNAEHQVSTFLGNVLNETHVEKMSVIDEKQEAIAHIRTAVDNSNLGPPDNDELYTPEDIDSQHWQLGSPEGKKSNLRVISAELGREHEEYSDLDKRVRDFLTCHIQPEETMRYEDDIYVSLFDARC